MNERFLHIIHLYLQRMNYLFNRNELRRVLLSDSDDGVLPITNTLDYFGIKNLTAKVPKESFDKLPSDFIAQIKSGDKYDLVLILKENDLVSVIIDDKITEKLSIKDFCDIWTGLIIAVEKNTNPINKKNDKKDIVNYASFICFLLICIYIGLTSNSLINSLYFTLSIIGLVISWFIVKEKLSTEETSYRLCTLSKKTDCKGVLNSSQSKLLKFIDLSDASVIYFTFICTIFLYNQNNYLYFILAFFSLPIISYSIYSQYFLVKKWCPLCLGIVTVLILQFLMLFLCKKNFIIEMYSIPLIIGLLGIISMIWYFLKKLLITFYEKENLVIDNLKFRRNKQLFLSYYSYLDKIDTEIKDTLEIKLGSNTPTITLIVVTNPLCENCFTAYKVYHRLLQKYEYEIQIIVRFFVPCSEKQDPQTQVSERLLQLYKEENKTIFLEAYTEWYNNKITLKKWFEKWKYCDNIKYNRELHRHRNWCLSYKLDYTPIIVINQKIFPLNYNIKDIEDFIEPIIELNKTI